VAVPLPLSAKVTPEGSAPVSESDGVGNPPVVTVKDPAVPLANVVLAPEVMDGAWSTVRVKDCEAFGRFPLLAEIVIGCVPPVPAPGVPDRVAVPLPLSVNVTPDGRAPDSEIAGAGLPLVVTVKLPALPVVKVVLAFEVMDGADSAWTIWVEPNATGGEYGGVPELPLVGYPSKSALRGLPKIVTLVLSLNSDRDSLEVVPIPPVAVNCAVTVGSVKFWPPSTSSEEGSSSSR
jgi:hypothetical protein